MRSAASVSVDQSLLLFEPQAFYAVNRASAFFGGGFGAESGVIPEAVALQQLQLGTVFTFICARSQQFYAAHTRTLLDQRGSYDVATARAVNRAPPSRHTKARTAVIVVVSHPRALLKE